MNEFLYTATEYLKKLYDIYENYPTYYALGSIGSPATERNKARYKVPNAPTESFLFDCSGFAYKAIPLGWTGDRKRVYGGADPAKNMALFNCNDILAECRDVSTDFSNILPGEVLYMRGHVGIYYGNGIALECTSKWDNCVLQSQVTNVASSHNMKYKRKWLKHGKLPFVDYRGIEKPLTQEAYTTARIGEGLIKIARRSGITFEEIRKLNPQIKGPAYIVRLGQKVRIR